MHRRHCTTQVRPQQLGRLLSPESMSSTAASMPWGPPRAVIVSSDRPSGLLRLRYRPGAWLIDGHDEIRNDVVALLVAAAVGIMEEEGADAVRFTGAGGVGEERTAAQ